MRCLLPELPKALNMGIRLGGKIDTNSALCAFPQEVRRELARRAYPAFSARGDWIWEYPRNKELCLLISSGVVKIAEKREDTQTTRFVMGPGGILAVSAIPFSSPQLIGIAGTPCSYMKVSTTEIRNHPQLHQAFSTLMQRQKLFLKNLSPALLNGLGSKDTHARIASALIALSTHCGEDTECGRKICLPLTEADITVTASVSLEETRAFLASAIAKKEITVCGEHICLNPPLTSFFRLKRRHTR